MRDVVNEVLTDLQSEGDRLRAVVADLEAEGWATPTPAPGWSVATQVAHLAWTDEVAVTAAHAHENKGAWDDLVLAAIANPTGYVDEMAEEGAKAAPAELLARWDAARTALAEALRLLPAGVKMPWFGPPMSATSMATARLMETWAHALDVYDALGVTPERTDAIKHVCHLGVRTRNFAFGVHGEEAPAEEFRVSLTAPSGETWTWGPEDAAQSVSGSAWDFALSVTQRRHRADLDLVAVGTDADRWLDIAQAFAGPPGVGRSAS